MKSETFKVVFFGTSDFAQSILQILIEGGVDVVAVVTRPDKPVGRNLKLAPSFVKQYVQSNHPNLPVFTPIKSSTEEFAEVLKTFEPDLFVVAAYGEIIKPLILQIPRTGSINVHPSLLPKYRGPSPLQSALLNGDCMTGVCIIDVAEKMDAGDIFARKTFDIDKNDNFTNLQQKSIAHSRNILLDVVKAKKEFNTHSEKQDDSQATYCKKINPEDEKIDWNEPLETIHNKIRALSEKPCAWCYVQLDEDVKRVKIFESELIFLREGESEPNSKKSIFIQKGPQILQIISLQIEGKKRLKAHEWLSGLKTSYKFF